MTLCVVIHNSNDITIIFPYKLDSNLLTYYLLLYITHFSLKNGTLNKFLFKEDRGYYSIAIHQFSLKQLIFIQILLLNDR